MAGTLITSTIQGTTLTDGTNSTSTTNCIQGSAKAWVNFDGSTATPSTIRASYNVSSITHIATGVYAINFTNAFVDTSYVLLVTADGSGMTASTDLSYFSVILDYYPSAVSRNCYCNTCINSNRTCRTSIFTCRNSITSSNHLVV